MAAIGELEGAYALGILSRDEPHRLIAARQGSPLVVGVGIGEHFIGSDVLALAPVTRNVIYLEEGDVADLRCTGYTLYDASGKRWNGRCASEASSRCRDRGQYRNFTEKEIFEQLKAVADTLEGPSANTAFSKRLSASPPGRSSTTPKPFRSLPAARVSTPVRWRATGSKASPACHAMSRLPANTATAST
jgi:glucosamine 6-phosphate synthetase-like amidotransferase/phosphosugar isomerase protein